MSDVQTRPAASRGRGSAVRGGRGGLSRGGGRNNSRSAVNTNGHSKQDSEITALPSLEEGGEIADLNKTHGSKLPILKEMFPDWSEADLLYALKETDGDEVLTIERIAEGKFLYHRPLPTSFLSCYPLHTHLLHVRHEANCSVLSFFRHHFTVGRSLQAEEGTQVQVQGHLHYYHRRRCSCYYQYPKCSRWPS